MNGTAGEGERRRRKTRGEEKGGLWLNYSQHHGRQRTFSFSAQAPTLLLILRRHLTHREDEVQARRSTEQDQIWTRQTANNTQLHLDPITWDLITVSQRRWSVNTHHLHRFHAVISLEPHKTEQVQPPPSVPLSHTLSAQMHAFVA